MSVSDGQNANATTFNGAFPSKSTNSTVTAIWTLNNATPASGPSISNLQASINGMRPQIYSLEQIANGGTVTTSNYVGWQSRLVESTSGTAQLANKLFGSGGSWLDRTIIELVGNSNSLPIKIVNADEQYGAILNGDCTLLKYHILVLQYYSNFERWVEIRRNNA